ncbi:hypothetical protein KUCAC02_000180, partial [Chaenocephalus aceratus]
RCESWGWGVELSALLTPLGMIDGSDGVKRLPGAGYGSPPLSRETFGSQGVIKGRSNTADQGSSEGGSRASGGGTRRYESAQKGERTYDPRHVQAARQVSISAENRSP